MLTFDISMPLVLFGVTLAALLLSKRVEPKLKVTFEEREFKPRDAVIFVVLIAVAVSVVAFIPEMALVSVFLFSYCALLFTFSFLFFSNIAKPKAQFFFLGIALAAVATGTTALLKVYGNGDLMFYGGWAAIGLAAFSFLAIAYEQLKPDSKSRVHLGLFPALLLLIVFFLFMYNPVPLLSLILVDVIGALFAVLITLYLTSLFTWKVTFLFATLLTVMDIVLVLVTGFMIQAATHVAGLGLPVLIQLPLIPPFTIAGEIQHISLGLGDFFFAGTLATQTYKKFDKRTGIISAVAMTVSFGIFEAALLSTDFGPFPGTVMIILGWIPIVAWKLLSKRKSKSSIKVES